MAEGVIELNDQNFQEETKQGVTVIDFWAPWCAPCNIQGPIVDEVAAEVGSKAKVAKANVDEAGNLAAKYGIRAIPTLIILKEGELVDQKVGLQNKESLIAAVEKAQG